MDKKLFQETFSAVCAPEETLLEVLKMKENKKRSGGKILRVGLVAALLVCLLATTAWAAPLLRKAISGKVTDSWDAYTPTDEAGNSYKVTMQKLILDVPLNADAPELIEEYYMPQIPEVYPQNHGFAYGGLTGKKLCMIQYSWDVPGGEKWGIWFNQESRLSWGEDGYLLMDEIVAQEATTLAGVEGFFIEGKSATRDVLRTGKQFIWTDGSYVFHLRVPSDFTMEQLEQLVGSVSQVEDIRPYMVKMTEEQIEKTFG